ncbi:MAG: sigma-70 family RNA polymerase sigma factor [Oscillospiraceae bacterium]|nr:sigma-70 family RNA polymerase sigma factor [Oscillospiraceae bacterium]
MNVPDFGEIYAEHFTPVYKYVMSLCRDSSIAEEITQETFFKALKNISGFNGDSKLYVWLCQIARNTYFTYYKKCSRSDSLDSIPSSCNGVRSDPEQLLTDKESARKLHMLLHSLSDPYKEVFTLRVFGELSFIQIGELFNKTDSWARLIYYRAKKQLQEEMK